MRQDRVEDVRVAGSANPLDRSRLPQKAGDARQRLEVIGTGALGRKQQEQEIDRLAIEGLEVHRLLEPGRETEEALEDGEYHPIVIAEDTRSLHRMSVSDAVVELDLTGAPVVVFVHAGTGRMNVVYRRGDGAIGWIDPPSGQA